MTAGQGETEPLLAPRPQPSDAAEEELAKSLVVAKPRSAWHLVLLAIGIGGLQVAWSVDMSSGSPYLLSLGMSKVLLGFVRLAGPVMGIVVQPYVGMLSDKSRFTWGRRRPFIVAGTIWSITSIMFLAWVSEIVTAVVGGQQGNSGQGVGIRSTLIVDTAPDQQEAANGMASRGIAVGNIVGFLAGSVDLMEWLPPWLGNTQFRVLCAFASLILAATILTTVLCIHESPGGASAKTAGGTEEGEIFPRGPHGSSDGGHAPQVIGLGGYLSETANVVAGLSEQIRKLCAVQLFACFAFTRCSSTRQCLTLKRAWIASLMLLSGILCLAPFVKTAEVASYLVASLGYTWAIFAWAPFAIIGADRREAEMAARLAASERPLLSGDGDGSGQGGRRRLRRRLRGSDAERAHPAAVCGSDEQDRAGAILGIHNMAMCTAQLASTGVALIVFGIWQQPRGTPRDHSLGIILGVSGVAGLVSVWVARGFAAG
ncbi:unnamed protein product [Parascedosporium putredinis]|uniref:Sucrose transporter n=1 Tax=Parascedosporium putredinis TaxID=1442378 RepID=A0A9P1MFB8_9PEZI|nr:unnamed protein product [Parascedosporium putredinis]CAI8003151.1 unnamed protein product [Parascedosporium putredinis]